MTNLTIHQEIIDKIYNEYKIAGYVTEENVLNSIIERDLSLVEVDFVCDSLLSMGVIIEDDSADSNNAEDLYDRSQVDYESLFKEVVSIDNTLLSFIERVRKIRPPQRRELQNLIQQAKNNNAFAKERIIEMYLRTVIRIALWHHKKYKIALDETIQDGCVGLVIALDKFEMGKHYQFSTYAPWWIRQTICREAPTLNTLLYIPAHLKDKLFSIYDILDQHFCEFCMPSAVCPVLIEIISNKLDCELDLAKDYIGYLNKFDYIEQLVIEDENIFNDNGEGESVMIQGCSANEARHIISELLKTLKDREERVLLKRFGFFDGNEWTLERVGNEFGVTRERIRQIEAKAMRKLKHSSRIKVLKGL